MVNFEDNPQDRWAKPRRTTDSQFDFDEVDNLLARDYVQNNKIQLVRNITPSGVSSPTMKVTDGTDILAVNADGSINVNTGKAIDVVTGQAVNTTTTLKTVGVGKKTRVYGYDFGISDTGSATGTLTIGTKTFVKRQLGASARDSAVDFSNKYIELAAGATITLTSSAATLMANASVWFEDLDA